MKNWVKPCALKSYVDLWTWRYYHKFVKDYAKIVPPLIAMLLKKSFARMATTKQAFEKIKLAMCTTLGLVIPNFSKMFVIVSNACGVGVVIVLIQEGCLVVYKALIGKNLAKCTCVKEMFAFVQMVTHSQLYLLGRHFKIKTYHHSLKYLLEQWVSSLDQLK